jgi:predicted Zn-ribbon and HTH transcriptional regulator
VPKRKQRKGFHRGGSIVPKFTDEQIEKMIRESDEGKTARQIMQEYGFKSTQDWYLLKSKYKKKQLPPLPELREDLPEHDDADDEEDDEAVLVDNPLYAPNSPSAQIKRYSYECKCGYSFKSTIPPQLIKCPDCMGKPKVVEEVEKEEP